MQGADLQRADIQRCAVYTRKSTDERLERDYNSLASQRDICSAYIRSQRHKGWIEVPEQYDDPAQCGGTLERPGLERLMDRIERGAIDVIVIYKIDRLTRSVGDLIRLMDLFEKSDVSFVATVPRFPRRRCRPRYPSGSWNACRRQHHRRKLRHVPQLARRGRSVA